MHNVSIILYTISSKTLEAIRNLFNNKNININHVLNLLKVNA